jgi:hypothetical protein
VFSAAPAPPLYNDSGIAVSEPAQTNSAIVGLDGGAASAGQILVAVIGLAEADVNSPPAGWSLIGTDSFVFDGDTNIMRVYWRLAGGAEPATYTWGLDAVGTWLVSIASYNDADPVQPHIAPAFEIYNAANVNQGPSDSISPTDSTSMLILAHLLRRSVATGATFTVDPAGMTKREDESENNPGGFMRLGYWDAQLFAAGPTGALTATTSSNLRWLTMIMALTSA